MTAKQFTEKGWHPLAGKELRSKVAANSIHLSSSDFAGYVFLREDGRLAAKDYQNNLDSGLWAINNEHQLCLKFKDWYYGDNKCYSVYAKAGSNSYNLFTNNGVYRFSATIAEGDSAKLGHLIKKNKAHDQGLSKQTDSADSSQPATPPMSKEETAPTVKTMAQDCPGCNLEGADLKGAELIGANLEGANLRNADLRRANLRRANLKNADLSGALLSNANLPGADLRNCNLSNANLNGANLIMADLRGADTNDTIFSNAHLEGVKGFNKTP